MTERVTAEDFDILVALAADAKQFLDQLGLERTTEEGTAAWDQRRSIHDWQMLSHQTLLLRSEYDALTSTDDKDRDNHAHKVRQHRECLEAHLADVQSRLAGRRKH